MDEEGYICTFKCTVNGQVKPLPLGIKMLGTDVGSGAWRVDNGWSINSAVLRKDGVCAEVKLHSLFDGLPVIKFLQDIAMLMGGNKKNIKEKKEKQKK